MTLKKFKLPLIVFLVTFVLLAFVQLQVERPMLLAERFNKGAGWAEIMLIASYGAFVVYKMQDPQNVPKWRYYRLQDYLSDKTSINILGFDYRFKF